MHLPRLKFNHFFGSLETDMNQSSSHPNHENRTIYEEPPPQGLSVALGQGVFLVLVTDPPWGRPVGGGGIHRT